LRSWTRNPIPDQDTMAETKNFCLSQKSKVFNLGNRHERRSFSEILLTKHRSCLYRYCLDSKWIRPFNEINETTDFHETIHCKFRPAAFPTNETEVLGRCADWFCNSHHPGTSPKPQGGVVLYGPLPCFLRQSVFANLVVDLPRGIQSFIK